MPRTDAILVLEDDKGDLRKVLRLLRLSDGSFAITAPYHPATTGDLSKIKIPERVQFGGEHWVGAEIEYRVSSRVKLIYHPDGFVQFSSADTGKIISGSLPAHEFLLPKGLGIYTQPITDPISSGPTLGANFRGLGKCKRLDAKEKTPLVIIRREDLVVEMTDPFSPNPEYGIEFWFFPADVRREATLREGRWRLEAEIPGVPVPVPFRVVDLATRFAFVGILVRRYVGESVEASGVNDGTQYFLVSPRSLVGEYQLVGHFPASDKASGHSMDYSASAPPIDSWRDSKSLNSPSHAGPTDE